MSEDVKTEKLTTDDAVAWYVTHKNKIYAVILLLVGALGGNVDKLVTMIPDVHGVEALKTQVNDIDTRVKALEAAKSVVTTAADDGVKVERPLSNIIKALAQ